MKRRQVLVRGEATPLGKLAIGASRIGGPPDLPADVEWPRVPDGRCMPLVLQLALDDITRFGLPLPASGTLYFFAAQCYTEYASTAIENMPAAIVHAPPGVRLVRRTLPAEASDDTYWDTFDICRIAEWRANEAHDEEDGPDDEPQNPELHVLMPVKKYSSAYGLVPPDGYTPILEMRSDYDIHMNWGDAAWATWLVPDDDLRAARFDRATAHGWIG